MTVDTIIDRVRVAANMHDLERAWTEGLRAAPRPDDRDRILVEASRHLSALDALPEDRLRRNWLGQVVEEVRTRGEGSLSEELASVAAAQMREAFAHASAEIAELRAAVTSGEDLHGYAAGVPLTADRIRDLGRMAQRLRGSGLMTLVSNGDAGLARELAAATTPRVPLVPTVPDSWRVSRDDLLRGWDAADRELPRLVHSLIAETVPSAEMIHMPAGTGVAQSGWDGRVRCSEGNRFVPDGQSVWEMSAQKSGTDGKARRDYDNRVQDTPELERAEAAYVAVMCAPWRKAQAFADEMSQRGDFNTVRTCTVDDLEAWLACAPATTVWMREQLGKPVEHVFLLSEWWERWLASTTVPLNAQLVLAGRDESAESLRGRCRQRRGGVITIGGAVHRDEILAFVAAALESSDASLASVLYVEDRGSAQRLLHVDSLPGSGYRSPTSSTVTVVVPSADFADCLPRDSRHRLIVPVPGEPEAHIVLEPVDSEQAAGLLQDAGLERHTAHELGSVARMSLLTLRRRLAHNPEIHHPAWASGHIDGTIRRCLLLHGWNATFGGDRQALERFVGRSYDDATEALSGLDSGDAPMILTDERWHVVSPSDAWTLVSAHLTSDDIGSFAEIAHEVLTEPDPFQDMNASERMQAQYEGTTENYSHQLKHGVATTLALLGSNPPQHHGAPAMNAADGIASRILRTANNDPSPRTWASVAQELPLLAEASPTEVLAALRTCLANSHDFTSAMFAEGPDEDSFFMPTPPYVHVLWALESLAWACDHLNAAADMLARLAAIDPGARSANRPTNSLASILCPWMPHTSADADARWGTVNMLRRRHNATAWELMLSMLPNGSGHQVDARGPRYRRWKRRQDVSPEEHRLAVESAGRALVEEAGQDPERWAALVQRLSNLTPPGRAALAASLSEIAAADPDEAFRSVVWPQLRDTLSKHREHSDTWWTLPEDALAPFDPLLQRLCPANPADACSWLFESSTMAVDGIRFIDDHAAHEAALTAKRIEAVRDILDAGGVAAVMALAEKVSQPYEVGVALAGQPIASAMDDAVCEALDGATGPVLVAALTYFDRRFKEAGLELMDQLVTNCAPSDRAVADLLRAAPADIAPWSRADEFGPGVADEYWQRVNSREFRNATADEACEAATRLRQARRTGDALELFFWWDYNHAETAITPTMAEEIATCLEDHVRQDADEQERLSAHELSRLVEITDQHSEHLGAERLTMLKWQYRPALEAAGSAAAADPYLMIAQDPDIFVSLVEAAYRPASATPGGSPEPSEAEQRAASNAYDILHSWRPTTFNPGSGSDNQEGVGAEGLADWVHHARRRLAETDRQEIGDMLIGTALASSPADPGGGWPGAAVRDLIEDLSSDDLDHGLSIAKYNQRGATSRALTDGGQQESDLAARYRELSRQFCDWPRTAAILDGLARSYENEAEMHDRRAEAWRRGLWG